ncbi:hypothetical protein [Tannockella kyphosi]|uniref:hypothetical protein n=1 Tax=Tannockella kyphosi TaxID=2899121 RepID=UPI00201375A5|nr:hypothetical protein [Tannockella kyphosi]
MSLFLIVPIIIFLTVIIIFIVVLSIIITAFKNAKNTNNAQQISTPPQTTPTMQVKEKLICEYCGGKYNSDDTTCPHCGANCH